jgi:hypothetical protein
METVVDWLLVRVTVFAAEVVPTATVPKARAVGLNVRGRFPVPLRAMVWGESGAPSVMAREPGIDPATMGAKVTFTAHVAPAARLDPQVVLDTA